MSRIKFPLLNLLTILCVTNKISFFRNEQE